MVSDCLSAGYLARAASQHDGRRTILQLTSQGITMLANFRQHQRRAVEYITRDWPDQERLEFAWLLLKYVDAIDGLRERETGTSTSGVDADPAELVRDR